MNEGEKVTFSHVGEDTGRTYSDENVLRVKTALNSAERFQIDRIRRELIGPEGAPPSAAASIRAGMLGDLNVRIVKGPSWWESSGLGGILGMQLKDDDVIAALHKVVMEKDVRVARALKEEAEQAQAQLKDQKQAG